MRHLLKLFSFTESGGLLMVLTRVYIWYNFDPVNHLFRCLNRSTELAWFLVSLIYGCAIFNCTVFFEVIVLTGIFRIWKIVIPNKCLCYFWRITRKIYVFLNFTASLFIFYKLYRMTLSNMLFYSFIRFIVNIIRIL